MTIAGASPTAKTLSRAFLLAREQTFYASAGVEKTMKLNRRHFLSGLIAVGSTLALLVALADATPAQVNTAWKGKKYRQGNGIS
jgi:hypothetical protein